MILVIVVGAGNLTNHRREAPQTAVDQQKNRTIAATLAEQDQERIHAISPTALIGHSLTQTVSVPAGGPRPARSLNAPRHSRHLEPKSPPK